MLGWYAAQYNFVIFGTDVNPEDRSQITLQFRPPDLSYILDPVREDLIHLANPGPTEIDTLLQVQLRQIVIATPSNTTDMTFGELRQAVPQIAWNDLLFAELSTLINWQQCVENMENFEPVQKLYIISHKHYSLDKIKSYLMKVKEAFIVSHRSILLRYLNDVNRLAFLVGYPQRLTNEDLVWKPFATIATDPNDYFASITRLLKQQSTYRLSQIGTYLDADDTILYEVLRPTIQFNAHLAIMGWYQLFSHHFNQRYSQRERKMNP
ncbi:hypothetical protein ANCDUO_23211 [Ancylostoma duodenale]|uniref:Uncharacterized protein n=1 Tax=Ancylostoma duodenale TaxID=51022 RepID=A0A0C2FJ03_9BILA|nr:hypothetical protein ANCDUO_23211 [Ancylostoma duodenale]